MNDDHELLDPPRLVDDALASDALRALVRDARELAPPALPTEVRARVRSVLAERTRSRPPAWPWIAGALALAAIVLVAWLWSTPAPAPSLPATPSPLVAEPADAACDGGLDAGPLEPAEPRELVPYVEVTGNGCGLDLRVSLTPLDDDVRSVALVLAEHPDGTEPREDGALDCEGTVVRELDASLFRDAARVPTPLALPLSMFPPEVRCGGRYTVTPCVRDALGRLATRAHGFSSPTPTSDVEMGRGIGRVETPSDPVALADVMPGHVVTAFLFQTSPSWTTPGGHWPTFVEAHVLRALRDGDVPAGEVSIELEDHRVIRVSADQGVWVAEEGYRPARELTRGMRVLSLDGRPDPALGALDTGTPHAVSIVAVRLDEAARLDVTLDVTFPDSFFLDGVLVHDAGPDTRHTGPLATFTRSREAVRAMPESSWDCSLSTAVVLDELPAETPSVAIVFTPHRGRAGQRMPMTCEQGTVGAELPTSLLAQIPAMQDGTRSLVAALSGWDEENDDWHPAVRGGEAPSRPTRATLRCSTEYAVLACLRGTDGALRSLPGASGRWALTGPACFGRGTPIDTPEGPRPIESLTPDDRVTTRDLESGELRTVRVRALIPRGVRPIREISLASGQTLRVTDEHPLYDPERESFRVAGSFVAGEHLLSPSGQRVAIEEIRDRGTSAPVYDLSVEAPHTYVAGGVIAHNY